jgi:hypothetical protein
MKNFLTKRQPTTPQAQIETVARRIAANLGIELTQAGAQVLRDEFNFTPEQIDRWMALMIERAEANREGTSGH